jgi:dolichyl-phosphate-mannose--protein O-mannosyl transferase
VRKETAEKCRAKDAIIPIKAGTSAKSNIQQTDFRLRCRGRINIRLKTDSVSTYADVEAGAKNDPYTLSRV